MAKRPVTGGKKIDTETVTVEGKVFEIDIFMTKVREEGYRRNPMPIGSTLFVVINNEFDIRHEGPDLNAITALAKKEIRERAVVTWSRMMLVTVDGTRRPDGVGGFYDPEAIHYPFGPEGSPSYGTKVSERSLFGHPMANMDVFKRISLKVEMIETTTILGEKKWRYYALPQRGRSPINDGWPEVGEIFQKGQYGSPPSLQSVVGMVPDTTENRASLLAIVEAMETLLSKLDSMLGANLQETLTRVFASGAGPLLSSGSGR
jgi:hypothetical protein